MKHVFRFLLVLAVVSLGASSARSEQVLFAEVMYHPPGTLPEYIEVVNNTATPFDIAQWKLRDGVDYDFPAFAAGDPARTYLRPFTRILLTSVDEATLRAAYTIPANVRVYGPWTGSLDNGGERITLKDKNDVVVCTVAYGDRPPWPVAADGAGASLVLRNADKSNDDWRNWTASARRLGTPGSEAVAQAETAVANPEVNLNAGIPFVNYGDSWRFHDRSIDLGTAWRAAAYDDSAWSEGVGLFGFETASLPAPGLRAAFTDADQLTFYLRTRFVYSGSLQNLTLTIDQILDDGAVYYLNGQEIGRSGMAASTSGFAVAASRTVTDAVEELGVISTSGAAMVQGTNVLAVEVHQANATSSDVVFGARLNVSVPSQASLLINEVLPAAAGIGFVEIYNPTASAINLRHHYFTDDPANLTKFRVATDVMVPAGGLASVGFAESGLAVSSSVKVYLVNTNGTAVLNAISSTMALDGRSLGRKPAGSNAWFLFADPTRNAANASQTGLALDLSLNEVQFSSSNTVASVEFHNRGDLALSLQGLFLASDAEFSDKVPLSGTVSSGGYVSQDFAFPVSGGEVALYLVNAADTVLSAHVLRRPVSGDWLQAFPNGAGEWYGSALGTPNAANNPARHTNVVINEIMYDPPSDERAGEFVELYNRGAAPVDLSGWRFVDGIDFAFPPGTVLAADSYLVVAADVAWMQAAYGALPIAGNFSGQLGNNGERLRLVDATGNLVDEVDYLPGGDWPNLCNGDGSSMELRHPAMHNGLASAWADSNETNKTTFAQYRYSDVYRQLRADGTTADHRELHLHLVGDGHLVLQNIQMRLNAAGGNVIANGNQMSTTGNSANGWLAQGTHYATYFNGPQLNLIADGHGDNRANRVEIDVPTMTAGQSYEVSFEARWVSGASRLIVQTWDHSIATSIPIPVPKNLGTPGARNSRYVPQPAPQVDGILHSPVVPTPGQIVRVTAAIHSPIPVPQVLLYHRLDNANNDGAWSNKPMFDNGASGDAVAGDGIYSAQLTEYGVNAQVVQFYVVAQGNGQASQLPKAGPAWPAMYVVDTPGAVGDLRRMRFVIGALDLADISGQDSPTGSHGYAFPRLANHYYNMTLIINERDVVYGCEVRNSGSPWTRGGGLDRGKFKLPKDKLFRGKIKQSYDNDAAGASRHHNRIIRYWLYLLGHPANENEYFQLEVNAAGAAVREEVEPVGNDMLNRIYADGGQGELYRMDDEWWFQDNWARSNRDADWSYKGTDESGRYRTEWIKRTRENEDDFTSLISFFKTLSAGTYTQAQIERLIDPVAVMQMAAVRGYVYDWDSFTLNRGKNGYFYRRSTDGKFMFLHWDSDLAFQDANNIFYNGMVGYRPYHEKPYNLRLYKHYLTVLLEQFTRNSARMNAWLQAEEDASSQYTVSTAYQTWFVNRETPAFNHLGASRTTPFDITSNGGNPITTSATTVNLAGTAPLRAFRVEVVGHPEAIFTWTTENGWSLTNIVLKAGANSLTVNAVAQDGVILHTDTMTVNKTGNAPPIMALEADPKSWRVSVVEALEIDARESYDPDGLPLSFTWLVSPAEAQLEVTPGGEGVATFPHPGLYSFAVTGRDASGASANIQREAVVYAPEGLSSFNQPELEGFWTLSNLELRRNHRTSPYYSLTELEGNLVLQVLDDRAFPLTTASPQYPALTRPLPSLTDWALLTKLELRGLVFGDYITGLLLELNEGGAIVRYAFGIEDGTSLNVRRMTSSGTVSLLRTVPLNESAPEIRVRRTGNSLGFEQRLNEVWTLVHSAGIPAGTVAVKGGLFLATDTRQAIKVASDFVVLVDPSATSDLRESLRISEIMYNPVGGGDYEFVELINVGAAPLDLTGLRFSAGIDYTFGPTLLAPRQFVTVVKNQAAFASRYNTTGVNIAPGIYSGQLNNDGETISISDSNGILILSLTYGTSGAWPTEADGAGSSLEAVDPTTNPSDPANWRASPEANGSPGRPGGDALGSVIVNEVLSHSDVPFEDALEVFNRTDNPVDLGGWFLSDSKADFKKYRIPDGTVVPGHSFHVFYESAINTNNPRTPFSFSSASGDQAYLSAADSAGNLTGYRSGVDFGPALNGVSFGRYETSVGRDFTALTRHTFGSDNPATLEEFRSGIGLSNSLPRVGPVVINEIMYHPPDAGTNDNTQDEFIELFNITGTPVALYDPAFPTNTWHLRGGADFNFPTNITLAPHGFVVVVSFNPATNAAALAAFRSTYALPGTALILGPYSGKLNNQGEDVRLNQPDMPEGPGANQGLVPYVQSDRVTFSDEAPWPARADGAGESLARRRPHEYGHDPVNWKGAAPTPGRANVAGHGHADADNDGLPDTFEAAQGFSSGDPGDASLDADTDGKTNYEEFLDGTNPRLATDRLHAPMISAPPQAQAVAAGGSASFNVGVGGSPPFTYQWRFNGVAIAGETNASLSLSDIKPPDAGFYAVVVRNAAGFVISADAALSVNQPLEILAQPQSRVTEIGGSVAFSVFAAGTGPLTYQWRFNGMTLPLATSSTLAITNAQPQDGGNYSVVVTDSSGSLTSADATLSVQSPPVIVRHPFSQTAVAYSDIFFSVTAGGDGPFSYQWKFNGANIPGAINATLQLPNVQPEQAGAYRVEVANAVSSVLSSNANLTLLIPATITQQPVGTNVAPGATVVLSVAATSSTPITYQWRFNDVDIPGATGSSLTITNVQEEKAGNYLVVVTDGVGPLRSQVAVVGVVIPLSIVYNPLSQSVVHGGSITFSVEVRGGPPPYGFEWRKGAFPLVSNALFTTKSFFTLSNVQPAEAGNYRAVVRNITQPFGIGSPLAQLTVLPDFDRDGLPDSYEQALGMNTNNMSDAMLDLDGDGVSTRDEYISGTDPTNSTSYLWIDRPEVLGGTTLWFPAQSNKTYTIQFNDHLGAGPWQKVDDIVAWPSNHVRSVFDPQAVPHRTYRAVTPRQP